MEELTIQQAAYEEQVNIELLAILEERTELDEYFVRKDGEEFNGYKEWS